MNHRDAGHQVRLVREMIESPEDVRRLTGLPTDERRVLRTLAAIWGFEPSSADLGLHVILFDKFQHGFRPK